ncbi:MAG: cation:proton antiporter [Alphaproteobacteria bacterium]|nr:cation:proton antiporter [Alphaproteobacteria bacterium]MBO6627267.1 cation:proton antiporter [Alphaproteobacteria bacterium]MDF1626554.1 cation:proton antiporter [Parvibaculaceae bacterium]
MEAVDGGAGHAEAIPYLKEIVVFLVASVLVVPLFQWMRASPVFGYLAVGALIGPFGLAVIDDVEGVIRLAELGVVFLLFTIGLELSFERLLAMRRLIFGLGGLQVLIVGLVIVFFSLKWGNTIEASLIIGFSLALSSTAIVTQVLIEKGEFATPLGRRSFAILLFQDLAVVPLIMLVSILANGGAEIGGWELTKSVVIALVQAVAAIAFILIVGRFALRYLFRLVTWTKSPELFMALTLLAVLSTAWATGQSGLSMALGAFLAGLVLSETEFRPQVEIDIQPFKGLLLGLFFISVGMGLDFGVMQGMAYEVFVGVVGLILVKSIIITALTVMFGVNTSQAIRTGLLLSAGGEFAFVVFGAALATGVMDRDVAQYMLIVAGVSLVLTPLLMLLGDVLSRLIVRFIQPDPEVEVAAIDDDLKGHVIIAGYGRVGRTVARVLSEQMVPFIALDMNATRARLARQRGEPVFYGDAARHDMLDRVGADRAAAIVITLNDFSAATRAVGGIRAKWPKIPVFVRAHDMTHTQELLRLGATGIVPETLETSLQLATELLYTLGIPHEALTPLMDKLREEGYARVNPDLETAKRE